MSIKPSAAISDPAIENLKVYSALADLAGLVGVFKDNPKIISQIAQQVAEAHRLTQDEKDERDFALAQLKSAHASLLAKKEEQAATEKQIALSKSQAEGYHKSIVATAENYKENIMEELDQIKANLDAREGAVKDREDKVLERENKVNEEDDRIATENLILVSRKKDIDTLQEELAGKIGTVSQRLLRQ